MDENTPPGSEKGPQPSSNQIWQITLLILLLFWGLHSALLNAVETDLTYSDFKTRLARGEVAKCEVGPSKITGLLKPQKDKPVEPFVTYRVEDPGLVAALEAQKVDFSGASAGTWPGLAQILGYLFFTAMLWYVIMRFVSPGAAIATMSRSRARLVAESDIDVDFSQVAGCEEAKSELREVVDFLGHPLRYQQMGAHIPKGVLLLGPPGTGKTLLARAVAGEARVPFYSISGSDFVEMFVGVGASRVRDLFEQAKKAAPCIVFIDELDAVGRERGVRVGNVNDEREQTLNQLLVEMDGFAPNSGVVLLAATNRPEILDRALLRPGRFDRRVILDLPDMEGRLAILRVHTKGKPIAPSVDLQEIARSTPGLSGADLANALNEAALMAARKQACQIEHSDLEQAVEKVVAGPERRTRRLSESEKERVAYHEAGHALVALHCEGSDPVRKVSIVPRGASALGYTLQLPREDHYLATRTELEGRLRVLLAGRAAEELIFGQDSTGAENDLERATALARQMVCLYGMSSTVGLGQCSRKDQSFLHPNGTFSRDCSEETAAMVDKEVRSLLDGFAKEAAGILNRHRAQLEEVAARLLQEETLEGETLASLLAAPASDANSRNNP
jgi:cell division protease FtsH